MAAVTCEELSNPSTRSARSAQLAPTRVFEIARKEMALCLNWEVG